MSTKTVAKAENKKTETSKNGKGNQAATKAVQKSKNTIEHLLNPSAESRVKRLETLTILAEKKKKIDFKLDELTNYNAGNDGTLSKMEFSADNGYKFTISNPVTITKILTQIETELFDLQERTNQEILDFQI